MDTNNNFTAEDIRKKQSKLEVSDKVVKAYNETIEMLNKEIIKASDENPGICAITIGLDPDLFITENKYDATTYWMNKLKEHFESRKFEVVCHDIRPRCLYEERTLSIHISWEEDNIDED